MQWTLNPNPSRHPEPHANRGATSLSAHQLRYCLALNAANVRGLRWGPEHLDVTGVTRRDDQAQGRREPVFAAKGDQLHGKVVSTSSN